MRYLVSYAGRLLCPEDGSCFINTAAFEGLEIEAEYPVTGYVRLRVLASSADILEPLELRPALSTMDAEGYETLSRAAQLAVWHDQHRYCGRCGEALRQHDEDLAKACPACGLVQYPRISPCIIVLVVNGDKCLLAHNPRFPAGRYSTLAGFIEAGETAEAAVAREVREEVGIEVDNVRYYCSQSWPFPHSLMLGFYADYAGGELRPDGVEITDAKWFDRDEFPDLPPSFAISRHLIDAWLKGDEEA